MSLGKVMGFGACMHLLALGIWGIWRKEMPMTVHRSFHIFARSLPSLRGPAAVRAGLACVAAGIALFLLAMVSS